MCHRWLYKMYLESTGSWQLKITFYGQIDHPNGKEYTRDLSSNIGDNILTNDIYRKQQHLGGILDFVLVDENGIIRSRGRDASLSNWLIDSSDYGSGDLTWNSSNIINTGWYHIVMVDTAREFTASWVSIARISYTGIYSNNSFL